LKISKKDATPIGGGNGYNSLNGLYFQIQTMQKDGRIYNADASTIVLHDHSSIKLHKKSGCKTDRKKLLFCVVFNM
jgi:hypothetical protein